MSSSAPEDAAQKYSCRCLNITINDTSINSGPANKAEPGYLPVFVGEDGIHIIHHYLTLRTRFRAQQSPKSPNKLIQPLALSCLACNTLAYRVVQEISSEAEAREGPVIPTEDWVEQETLRSKSGWIEVFVGRGGCLNGQRSIEQYSASVHISPTFSIGVLSPSLPSSPSTSPHSFILSPPAPDSHAKSSIPAQLLPSLPPLFPPPPFTPSHPVFVSLSACATERSAELRLRAEEEIQQLVRSQLDYLKDEEARLRRDVEGIWRGYMNGWKEVQKRAKEERQFSTTSKFEQSPQTASFKSGVPMSIRDFSPVLHSQRGAYSQQSTPSRPETMSHSLLSASLVHGNAHFPIAMSQSTELKATTPERTLGSAQSPTLKPSMPLASQVNGGRSPGSSSISIRSSSDTRMPGAFKRNMDTNVDIASSVAWAKGEEEMRRRLGGTEGEPTERARKRTSKNLGIVAVAEKNINHKATPAAEDPKPAVPTVQLDKADCPTSNIAVASSHQSIRSTSRLSPDADVRSPHTGSDTSQTSKKAKRRVTFDVLPDVDTITHVVPRQRRKAVPEVELFDLDDLSLTEQASDGRSAKPERSRPVARTPSYKLHANDAVSSGLKFRPASMPAPRAIPPGSPVNGASRWNGGSLKRSVGLADALPLLSSSVPAGDRVLTNWQAVPEISAERSRTPSPPAMRRSTYVSSVQGRTPSPAPPNISDSAVEPAEAELKNLLAASAPSHRHAWKEGGRAWEMFHQRSRTKKKVKGAIAEEDSDPSTILEDSESSSDDEDAFDGSWQNPSQFASSLPVQIRPLTEYEASLEPKTSLAEKQGVLVPPLQVTRSHTKNSAMAFRKAAYAERDRIRSIDPGPTLDFNEDVDEETIPEDVGEGERGRRHALSILQARSVIPEAGMWRSMAS